MEDNTPIKHICEAIEAAHAKIQNDFEDINPVVGVSKQMRTIGIAADLMTIDCLKSGKRILLVLHDARPDTIDYQFCLRDADRGDALESIPLQNLTAQKLYAWMKETFSTTN